MNPKIFIGIPTFERKKYCLKEFAEGLKNLTYPNKEILILDDSPSEDFTNEMKALGLNAEHYQAKFPGAVKKLIYCRNLLRERFLQTDAEYFFALDSDVVPPKDVIEKLLAEDRDMISGVYFNDAVMLDGARKTIPAVYEKFLPDKAIVYEMPEEKIFDWPGVYEVEAVGFGCLLLRRKVLGKIKFRDLENFDRGSEDILFCHDARQAGFRIFADTHLRCQHFTIPGGKWAGIKK